MIEEPLLADNGYPSEAELEKICTWDWGDFTDWADRLTAFMAYVKERWNYVEWGWREGVAEGDEFLDFEIGRRCWRISTGGWSGNEDLIDAMKANTMFWTLTAWSWRRGGHYVFVDGGPARGEAAGST